MSAIICKPSDVLRGIVGQCWWYSAYQPPAPGECHADHPSSLAKMDLRMIRWFCSSFVMNMSTNMVPQDKLNTCFMLWHLATCWSDKLNSCPLQKPPTPCVHSVPLLLDRMMSCMVIQGKFWSLCALIAMGSFQNWFLFSGETGDPPWVFGDHPIFICCFFLDSPVHRPRWRDVSSSLAWDDQGVLEKIRLLASASPDFGTFHLLLQYYYYIYIRFVQNVDITLV